MAKKTVSLGDLIKKLLGRDRRKIVVIRPDRTRIGPPAPVKTPR